MSNMLLMCAAMNGFLATGDVSTAHDTFAAGQIDISDPRAIAAISPSAGQSSKALNPDFTDFPHWQDMMTHEQLMLPSKPFTGDLKALLQHVSDKWMRLPYAPDTENYNQLNYWATREETLEHKSADCKGYDIAIYYDLLEAGVDENLMFIEVVYLRDSGKVHSVLKVGNWIFDNRADALIPAADLEKYYQPVFEINRKGWRAK